MIDGFYIIMSKLIIYANYQCLTPLFVRKARENIRWMVADEVSLQKIKHYFVRWARWWVRTATVWDFQTLVEQFISTCWHEALAAIATDVLATYLTGLDTRANSCGEILAA